MKRIYITSAVLLLLAIIAANFYMTDSRKDNGTIAPVPQTATTNMATQNDMAPVAPITDNTVVTTAPATETPRTTFVTRRRTRTTRKAAAETSYPYIYADATTDKVPAVLVSEKAPINVQRSNDYFGHKQPVVTTTNETEKKQRHFRLPENLGLEVGLAQSGFMNSSTSGIPVANVNAGLIYNFNLGNHFAFQPGAKYIMKGNKLQSTEDVDTKETLKLNYAELTAPLICKLGKVGNARIMVGAGPYAAYLMSAKNNFQTPGLGDGEDVLVRATPSYNTSNINRFDWGLTGFVGVQSPDGLFIKAGGEYGMTDVMKNTAGGATDRNYSMMVNVGLVLGAK